jgi:hypothetical protein
MAADIITSKTNFNQLQMTRYTMTYDHIPKQMFEIFLDHHTLDHALCDSFFYLKYSNKLSEGTNMLDFEINVKNQNQNKGSYK